VTAKKYGRLTGTEAAKLGYLPAKVYLNGTEIKDCVVFDDGEGWVDVYDREDGKVVVDNDGTGPRIKRLHGVVVYSPRGLLTPTKEEHLASIVQRIG